MVAIFMWGVAVVVAIKVALLAGAIYLIACLFNPSLAPTMNHLQPIPQVQMAEIPQLPPEITAMKDELMAEKKEFMEDCLSIMANDKEYCEDAFMDRVLDETEELVKTVKHNRKVTRVSYQ